MTRPHETPIGVVLARTAKEVSRAFDAALAQAGSSRPVWQILLSLKTSKPETQVELAEAIGIRGATLSHHLNAMESAGFITRTRNAENRRVHDVALTASGNEQFAALVGIARAHDKQLRAGIGPDQLAEFRGILDRLRDNVAER